MLPTSPNNPDSPLSNKESSTLDKLVGLIYALSAERSLPRLYEQIITAAQEFTDADGGTLYIVTGNDTDRVLQFEIMRTNSLGIRQGGTSGRAIQATPISLWVEPDRPNHSNVCSYAWHHGQPISIADIRKTPEFDFSGTLAFDQALGYTTTSLLTIPLRNHENKIIGILQLVNAISTETGQPKPFDDNCLPLILALASAAAVTLDKQQLIEHHKELLDAFVKVIAQAIDAKSSHTSNHCQRVPVITELLAQAACATTSGPLKDFNLDEEQWYELRVASWLHDCGKLATPDWLLDKSTKLHLPHDKMEAIQARFSALIAQQRLAAALGHVSPSEMDRQITILQNDYEFLKRVNQGGESMSDEDQSRVRTLAKLRWTDHSGIEQPLLSTEEVDMLCISRGTISDAERQQINRHIDVTIQMLESLPFPDSLARVPEYAGGHHEKIDGSGFPRGLTGKQMSWPARMMAIADIFEALTARDRPYKIPMPLSQALSILRTMRDRDHIDPDLYQLFLESGVWKTYAEKYLQAEQLDVTNISAYR